MCDIGDIAWCRCRTRGDIYWPCLLEGNGSRHRTYLAQLLGPSVQVRQRPPADVQRAYACLMNPSIGSCEGPLASGALSRRRRPLIDARRVCQPPSRGVCCLVQGKDRDREDVREDDVWPYYEHYEAMVSPGPFHADYAHAASSCSWRQRSQTYAAWLHHVHACIIGDVPRLGMVRCRATISAGCTFNLGGEGSVQGTQWAVGVACCIFADWPRAVLRGC